MGESQADAVICGWPFETGTVQERLKRTGACGCDRRSGSVEVIRRRMHGERISHCRSVTILVVRCLPNQGTHKLHVIRDTAVLHGYDTAEDTRHGPPDRLR